MTDGKTSVVGMGDMIRFFSSDDGAYLPILAFHYSKGKITRQELERWVVGHLPELLASRNELVGELVRLIELRLAEIALGHRNEDALRNEILVALSESANLRFELPRPKSEPVSSSSSIRRNYPVATAL